MSKAYVLIQFTLINKELFSQYIKGASTTIMAYGGLVIVAAENPNPQEGNLSTSRTTIIEFPSKDSAINWYKSAEYNLVKDLRHEATTGGSLLIFDEWKVPHALVPGKN